MCSNQSAGVYVTLCPVMCSSQSTGVYVIVGVLLCVTAKVLAIRVVVCALLGVF